MEFIYESMLHIILISHVIIDSVIIKYVSFLIETIVLSRGHDKQFTLTQNSWFATIKKLKIEFTLYDEICFFF